MQKISGNATLSASAPIKGLSAADAALDAAYRTTAYRVFCDDFPGGVVEIRVDDEHPVLDVWLNKQGTGCWSYLTADNPQSVHLPAEQNRQRFAALENMLKAGGKPFLIGEAVADNGAWPTEAGFLVAGMSAEDAGLLARYWGQNAYLSGGCGEVARLIWLQKCAPEVAGIAHIG